MNIRKVLSSQILLFCLLCTNNLIASDLSVTLIAREHGSYHISCPGGSDGLIEAVISGGVPPYSFVWVNSSGTFTSYSRIISGLPAEIYVLTVTDSLNNTFQDNFMLTEPDPLTVTMDPTVYNGNFNVTCQGCNNGQIVVYVNGGSPSYTYQWSVNCTLSTLRDISAGNYSVVVTDARGCTSTGSQTLTQPTPLHIISVNSPLHNGNNITCPNEDDGVIDILIAGGVPPYRYKCSGEERLDSALTMQFDGKEAGEYSISITDGNNVMVETMTTLTAPSSFNISLTKTVYPNGLNISCYNCNNGIITATTIGGTTPYSYVWSNGDSTAVISNLIPSDYNVTLTDASGCTFTSGSVFITTPEREDWGLSGNANTDSTTKFIGTTDSKPFIFKTNNTERIRIQSNGKISFKGEVKFDKPVRLDTLKINRIMAQDGDSIVKFGIGSLVYNQNTNNIQGSLTIANGRYIRGIGFGDQSFSEGDNGVAIGSYARAQGVSSQAFGRLVNSQADYSIVIGNGYNSGTNNSFLINNITKSIMLGANSPYPSITIIPGDNTTAGPVNIDGQIKINVASNNQYGGLSFDRLSTSTAHSEIKFFQNGNQKWALGNDISGNNGDNFFFWNHTKQKSIITLSNAPCNCPANSPQTEVAVGIDFDPASLSNRDPNYKLYVNGSIAAREIKVTANTFPDYVYEEDYNLNSIEYVHDYILKNKHLPDVPSAEEVAKNNGIEVGAFQVLLLKKIEEQMLYIVDLQKQINELKNR